MIKYVDYEWYAGSYLLGRDPVIPKSLFDYYATMATAEVRNVITLDSDQSDPIDEVKAATCNVAEILCRFDGNDDSSEDKVVPVGVSSEKVGEYSVSYTGNSSKEKSAEKTASIRSALVNWLGVTGLLYRGQ